MLVNNAAALAKAAKAFAVPTILTSVIADRGGRIFPQITDVFPGQEVIDRTFIHTWQDEKVVDAVKAPAASSSSSRACGSRYALRRRSRHSAKVGM